MNFLDTLNWVVGDISPPSSLGKFTACHHLDEGKCICIMADLLLPPNLYKSRSTSSLFSLPWQAALLVRIYEDPCKVSCTQCTCEGTLTCFLPWQSPAEQANSITVATSHLPCHQTLASESFSIATLISQEREWERDECECPLCLQTVRKILV